MKTKITALLLAAAMFAGAAIPAHAAEDADPDVDQEITRDFPGPGPGFRRRGGPRGDWRDRPDRDEWRHDRRDWGDRRRRDDRDGFRRGPGHPGGFGFHRGGPGGHRFGPAWGGFGPQIWKDLNLDDSQKAQLVDLLTANFRAGLLARMEMMEARDKVDGLRKNDDATAEDIIAANTELGAARGKLEAQRRKFRDDFRKVLTPEQLKKLDERRDRTPPPPPPEDRKPGDRRGPRLQTGPGPRR